MPETIYLPPRHEPRGPRRVFLFFLALLAILVVAGRTTISWWVDLLWFHSLGYESVFWKSWTLEWGTFAAFAALTFCVLYTAFFLLRRSHAADLPDRHTIIFGGRPIHLPVGRALHAAAVAIALLIALATGAAMQSQWATLALFWHAPAAAAGTADPIFAKPLNFYLFSLPSW